MGSTLALGTDFFYTGALLWKCLFQKKNTSKHHTSHIRLYATFKKESFNGRDDGLLYFQLY